MLSDATLTYGERAMKALLGVDALYRAESGDPTGLAVLNMDTEGRYPGDAFATYAEASDCFAELKTDAVDLKEADRRTYYDQLCHSTLAFMRWRTDGLRFESQLEDFLHAPAAPASEEMLDAIRTDLWRALIEMGYSGDLAAQAAAWEARHRVAPEAVQEVLTGLLSEAWDRTEEHLGWMPAEKSDGMKVSTVTGESYNARCDYSVRTIDINIDPVLTAPGLKHLAIHEGYPGHYLQFKLRETMAYAGTAAPDVLLSIVNSASSSVFEGIADDGIHMVNWTDSKDDRVQGLMNAYRAAIGTGAAWKLHGLGQSETEATDWLREQALTGGEGWVLNRMKFIAAPPRAVLIWSYWWGEQSVAAARQAVRSEDEPEFIDYLYGRMHSTKTVGMFEGGVNGLG